MFQYIQASEIGKSHLDVMTIFESLWLRVYVNKKQKLIETSIITSKMFVGIFYLLGYIHPISKCNLKKLWTLLYAT